MRLGLILVAVALVACGAHKASLVPVAPAFPSATGAQTATNASYSSTDWTLPAGTRATRVYDWYATRLTKLGWKVTQRNQTGLHAEKGSATLDVGVRGTTLEINRG